MSADWKTRQYVPDSDDDIEEEISQGLIGEKDEASRDTIEKEALELAGTRAPQEKDKPLDEIKPLSQEIDITSSLTDISEPAGQRDADIDQDDAASSALSSALSSISSTPSLSAEGRLSQQTDNIPQISLENNVADITPPQDYHPNRRFRERKAIQLNPYAIEGQLYKQVWKARGLVPLQVKNLSQQEVEKDADVSSGSEEETQRSDEVLPARSIFDELDMDMEVQDLGDEDFPDLQALLRPPLEKALQQGTKRRKLAHTYSKKAGRHSTSTSPVKTFPVRNDGWVEIPFAHDEHPPPQRGPQEKANTPVVQTVEDQAKRNRNNDHFPSPIQSSPSITLDFPGVSLPMMEIVEVEDSTTPVQLQTPATSSVTRQNGQDRRPVNDHAYHADKTNHRWVLSDSSEAEESPDDEDAALNQLVKAQRRTRGVLPASWHRLEYQKLLDTGESRIPKPTQVDKRHRGHVTRVVEPMKGVARRITKTRPDVFKDVDITTLNSTDSDSDSEPPPNQRSVKDNQQQIDNYITINDNDTDDDDDTNMEDNSIDIMASRNRGNDGANTERKHKRNKQTKIGDTPSIPSHRIDTGKVKQGTKHHTRGTHQQKRSHTRSTKAYKPRASILNITRGLTRQNTPNFLAFAARTARQRKDQGQHSPTQKRIRFQEERDNAEVDLVLQNWGHSQSDSTNHTSLVRQPLRERSANHAPSPAFRLNDESDEEETHPASRVAARVASTTSRAKPQDARLHSTVRSSDDSKPTKTSQRGHPVTTAIRPTPSTIPAQLEAEHLIRSRPVQQERKLVLSRFLQSNTIQTKPSPPPSDVFQKTKHIPIRRKKPTPRQLSIAPSIDQENDFSATDDPHDSFTYEADAAAQSLAGKLPGLLPSSVEYPITFEFERLPDGPHFSSGTLLGSGLFAQSLRTKENHGDGGPMLSTLNSIPISWDGWNEPVSEQVFEICEQALRSAGHSDHRLSNDTIISMNLIIQYLSQHLRFIDAVDCKDFASQWLSRLHEYDNEISSILEQHKSPHHNASTAVQLAGRFAVISDQIRQLTDKRTIDQITRDAIATVSTSILRRTLRTVFIDGFEDLRSFSKDAVRLADHTSRDSSRSKTEMFVIVFHLLQSRNAGADFIWAELKQQDCLVAPFRTTLPGLDLVWKNLFGLLPLLELDTTGRISRNKATPKTAQNWALVKQLIQPVFQVYSIDESQAAANSYCRALYARCFHLLGYWEWYDCESIMVFLFDFFARRGLRDLELTPSHGSPAFLNSLISTTGLTVKKSDRCFQVLLKLIGRGLGAMRSKLAARKIGNCVWRLTPNHDRHMPKDQAVRQEDLDAVRNHLDILAVLYWAAPADHRIRVDTIRRIVDIEDSHKEVCHIVVRTWSNLLNFQLSTQESVDKVLPFVDWFDEIVRKSLRLHRLARSEVETDARTAQLTYGHHFSRNEQEGIIARSQRHVESILLDAISSLEKAIVRMDYSVSNLAVILPGSLKDIFGLYDSTQPRTSAVILQLLQILQAWISRVQQPETQDSQGYGDWSGLEELMPENEVHKQINVPEGLSKTIQEFLSSLFGSDTATDEKLLQKLLDCWLHVVSVDIKADRLRWDDLIDEYCSISWTALRDTPQTRKYSPLFYSRLITNDPGTYERHKSVILQHWIGCLVERESLIKYQPELTTAILNQDSEDPLLENLPFTKENGAYNISLSDFLARRISLISSLLSNMRESLGSSIYYQLRDRNEKRKTYSDLLRHLMDTMKNNYIRLGEMDEIRGSYVSMVHNIVQLLQEHTSDIRKVDDFFLDAVNIPLPATDPEYLLGKLGNLALQLHQSGGAQTLGAFIQSLCERAVVEGQQDRFASYLVQAMEIASEDAGDERVTLRRFICCQLLPIYIGAMARNPCAAFVGEMVLLSLLPVMKSLLRHTNLFGRSSMSSVQLIVTSVLDSLHSSMATITTLHPLPKDHMLQALLRYFDIIIATLEAADYVYRFFGDETDHLLDLMVFFANSGLFLLGSFQNSSSELDPPEALSHNTCRHPVASNQFDSACSFIKQSLLSTMDLSSSQCKWRLDDEKLYVRRKDRWELIKQDSSRPSLQQQYLARTIKTFINKLATLQSFAWIVTEATINGMGWDNLKELESVSDEYDQLPEQDLEDLY